MLYEDFEVGQHIFHSGGRTILEADNTWFTLLTCNTHPVHFNADYAAHTEFRKPLVNSTLILAVVAGMTVSDLSLHAVANLGWEEVVLPHPVFAGDTLYADSEVLSVRESKSRPEAGVVGVRTWGRNQDGVVVMEFRRTFLVYKSASYPGNEVHARRVAAAQGS